MLSIDDTDTSVPNYAGLPPMIDTAQSFVPRNRVAPCFRRPPNYQIIGFWLAYSPPPLAVPLDYANTGKWNRWQGKYVSGLFIVGGMMDRQFWTGQNSISEYQVGDLTTFLVKPVAARV